MSLKLKKYSVYHVSFTPTVVKKTVCFYGHSKKVSVPLEMQAVCCCIYLRPIEGGDGTAISQVSACDTRDVYDWNCGKKIALVKCLKVLCSARMLDNDDFVKCVSTLCGEGNSCTR